jgi:hypothetical protein
VPTTRAQTIYPLNAEDTARRSRNQNELQGEEAPLEQGEGSKEQDQSKFTN